MCFAKVTAYGGISYFIPTNHASTPLHYLLRIMKSVTTIGASIFACESEADLLREILTGDFHGKAAKEAALRELFRRGALQAARAIASNSVTISCTAKVIEHNLNQLFVSPGERTFGHCP